MKSTSRHPQIRTEAADRLPRADKSCDLVRTIGAWPAWFQQAAVASHDIPRIAERAKST
jgi:hypothetical protein